MDAELAALAGIVVTTLVTLAATDGWGKAKQAIGWLWRRARPERPDGEAGPPPAVEATTRGGGMSVAIGRDNSGTISQEK